MVEAYEIGARAGHAIRNILEEMLDRSSFAFLVLTGEDETAEGSLRARQNVIHETGLFQGKLGFRRAVVLLEKGVEEFSNIEGIEQIFCFSLFQLSRKSFRQANNPFGYPHQKDSRLN